MAAMQSFSDGGIEFESVDEAVDLAAVQTRWLWPIYGPITDPMQWDAPDQPLPPETRLWVDQWRFRKMSEDSETFLSELSNSSSFNAAARRARAADPELAETLRNAGLPAPTYGLPSPSRFEPPPLTEYDLGDDFL